MNLFRNKRQLLLFSLILLLPFLGSLSYISSLRIRSAALIFPFWKIRQKIAACFHFKKSKERLQIELLESENFLLRQVCQNLTATPKNPDHTVAHVLYRDPTTFHSTLWINVGHKHNVRVDKGSPVLVGDALIGMVDYVGKKQSRVRLITDRTLQPSVRAVRGALQNHAIIEQLGFLSHVIEQKNDLPMATTTRQALLKTMEQLRSHFSQEEKTLYLAKGILQGSSGPMWRRSSLLLKGIGFNYDFDDRQGEARDLVTGRTKGGKEGVALLQGGDLLVTTGLDGIFPMDLKVAFVTSVYPLREGDVTYRIEAKPYVSNLDRIEQCIVMPPVGYDPKDKPLFP